VWILFVGAGSSMSPKNSVWTWLLRALNLHRVDVVEHSRTHVERNPDGMSLRGVCTILTNMLVCLIPPTHVML